MTQEAIMQTNPEQWAVDVRYLAKLAYWAAGEGFCQLKDMDDPDEWCFAKWNELKPESNGDDYSADTLAVALIASIQAAFAEREAPLVEALEAERIWHEEHDKAISKQPNANTGENGWRRMEHQEHLAAIDVALKGRTHG